MHRYWPIYDHILQILYENDMSKQDFFARDALPKEKPERSFINALEVIVDAAQRAGYLPKRH